jgi:hypothetical protein
VPRVARKDWVFFLGKARQGKANFDVSVINREINDIRKHRGDNPIQDSPVKKSAIRLFNENTTPDTVSPETELTLEV